MSRIVIADLPEIQDLSEVELQEVYGAGRPVRRKSRESFPGIVHLELLERREVFSATGLQGLVQAPTAAGIAVELQGSKVEKDAAGNTVFTQSDKGSVIRKSVFSPTGQLVSYERVQDGMWVAAHFQGGKLCTVITSKSGVQRIRQDFAADGTTMTKETQFDDQGKLVIETTWTGSKKQVTTYVDGKTAVVQISQKNASNADILIYEETWSGGFKTSQTTNSASGDLISKWQKNGNYEIETNVNNGTRDEWTYFIRTQTLAGTNQTKVTRYPVVHERFSDLKALSDTLATQVAQEKKAGHTIVNPGQMEQAITVLVTKPILRETWMINGARIKVESWSYQTGAIPLNVLNVPGQQLYQIWLTSRETTGTYDPADYLKQVRENKINGVLRERTVSGPDGILEEESWDSQGQQLTRKIYGQYYSDTWTETYEYTTEVTGTGKAKTTKTFVSMSSYRKNGVLERRVWFNSTGMTQRYYYQTENGVLRTTMKETFVGTTHKIVDLTNPEAAKVSILVFEKLDKDGVPVNERVLHTESFIGDRKVEETDFHTNGKVAIHWHEINADSQCRTYYNDKGQKTEQWILKGDRPESRRVYDPATGRDQKFIVMDQAGSRIQQVEWEYRSNGDVIKRSRDFQQAGQQEIQRREWLNGSASAYYLWNWTGNIQTCVVQRRYETGRLISDIEKAPDGTVVKDFAWRWTQVSTLVGYNWQSTQTRNIGRKCYDLTMPPGFSLSWGDAQKAADSVGAAVADAGEWIDGKLIDPIVEAAKKATEEAKKLEEVTKKLITRIEAAGKTLTKRIAETVPLLSEANAALKDLRKTAFSKLSWDELRQRANRVVNSTLQATGREVQAIKTSIGTAPSYIVQTRDTAVKDAKTALDETNKKVGDVKLGVTTAYQGVKDKIGTVVSESKTVWESGNAAVGKVVAVVKGLVSEDLFKVTADSVGKLSFNFATGGYYADFELLKGLKVDSEGFKALMTGDFKLPEIDPMSALATLSGLKSSVTTNYESVRQSQYAASAGANVYFSSRRMTEWAGPGTVARAVAAAIAGASGQTLAEAKSHFSLELEDLATWLQQRGAEDAPKLAVQILHAVLNQTALNLPQLSVRFTPVDFTFNYSVGGAIGSAGSAAGVNTGTSVTVSHSAFAIVWKGSTGSDPLSASINNLQSLRLKGGMDDFNALALRELKKLNLPGSKFLKEVLLTGHAGVDSDNALDKTVMNKLSDMLGVNATELLANYKKGNPIIDLSGNSRIKGKLTSQLEELAIGNKGSAEVTKLQFNLNTLSFEIEFVVHHKYASGSLADIGKQIAGMVS